MEKYNGSSGGGSIQDSTKLAAEHPDTTSFGRFADFENYYPNRKQTDEYVRESFIQLGGKPKLMHPFSFTLNECEYLRKWFSEGEKLVLKLDEIPDDQGKNIRKQCVVISHVNSQAMSVSRQSLRSLLGASPQSPETSA